MIGRGGLRYILLATLLWLAGCGGGADAPLPVTGGPSPALWEIESASGQRGWLLGTIHALPEGTTWRTERLKNALAHARLLVLEVPRLDDGEAIAKEISRLALTPGLGPVSARVPPGDAREVRAALASAGIEDAHTTSLETWAVAMSLNSATGPVGEGVDRQLLAGWDDRPVTGLETVADQLGAFDRLSQDDQAELLVSVIEQSRTPDKRRAIASAWRAGDVATLGALTREGMLARPSLRAALLERRNRAWVTRIARLIDSGRTPFIAVGAGHVAGRDGLPALLAAHGLAVRRIQ